MGAFKVGWLGVAIGETGVAGRGAEAASTTNARALATHVTRNDLLFFNMAIPLC